MESTTVRDLVLQGLDYAYPKSAADVHHHITEAIRTKRITRPPGEELTLTAIIEHLQALKTEGLAEQHPQSTSTGLIFLWQRVRL